MLIQGSAKSERTNTLIKNYMNLLENGINADEILVLLQNPYKKEHFIDTVKANLKINHFESPQIHTFYGLCYNSIQNNWAIIENTINFGDPVISPHLTGLEISQFFFRQAIKEAGFKDYNSKINLIHQLFRRNSLIVNNNLSEREVEIRSRVLKEVFDKDARAALEIFKKKTIEYRAFDYIRQVNIFNYIYKNTNYFEKIKYLIIDDADEITPVEFEFIKHLKPQLKDVFVGYDRTGTSRLGFLNADIKTVENIEELFKDEKKLELDNIQTPQTATEALSFSRRLEMTENALENVSKLLDSGVKPQEIVIITPVIDSGLKFAISEFFTPKHIDFQYLSGSEKLCENKTVKNTLTLLNLSLSQETDVFKIRPVLNELLNIPLKHCIRIIENYKSTGEISFCDLANDLYNKKLKNLTEVIEKIKNDVLLLSEKLFIIYENLVIKEKECLNDLEKFNFFAKQIKDFEEVFEKHKTNPAFQKLILTQIENSIISENPSTAPDMKENAITISTAQKVIDFSLKSKYQIWLDTSSSAWVRDDFGTLYNAWVFQKSWEKDSFTYEDNLELATIKAKKMIRKLSLLATEKIFAYSSLFDTQGAENFGGIEQYTLAGNPNEQKETKSFDFSFTPRDDQKPVLDYKSGKMAISAVPGAGKTTILLALIIKLLQNKVKSENIFVLTYMDSAARNFKERIKAACPSLEKLPNISTIHGLALRILKENSNFVKAGLDEDFEVCDDAQRQKIMREILAKLQYEQDDFEKYQSAVSSLKLSAAPQIPYTKDSELKKFLKFYYSYNLYLKNRNIIDYDDMLLYCVRILENNSDIAAYYQEICEYVIEDEAQDSSSIQQRLIGILSEKHKNLIRCGDINQAITTTFTNADLNGFRDFVNNSDNVSMNRSQRCAKDIYSLANSLVDLSKTNEDYKNAFFDIKMNEVKGKNPENSNAVECSIFEDFYKEREYILENIRKIFSKDKNASVAVLVRNNYNIDDYCSFFSNYGYNILTRSDVLNRQPVFSLIFALLKFCAHPWQNEKVQECAKVLREQKLLNLKEEDIKFVENVKIPFIMQNQDEIDSPELSKLLWDLNYWLENSSLNVEEFTLKAGNYYYDSEIEKSNVQMTALLLKTFENRYSSRSAFLDKLEESSSRPVGSKFKFFEHDDVEKNKNRGIIQIMTYHKSKGDEFDYVFIPDLDRKILPVEKSEIKIKSKERFLEAVKGLNLKYKKKDENEQKLFQIEENLRLFYVAITRAKKKLFITSSKKQKRFSRIVNTQPSILFDKLLNIPGAKQ